MRFYEINLMLLNLVPYKKWVISFSLRVYPGSYLFIQGHI